MIAPESFPAMRSRPQSQQEEPMPTRSKAAILVAPNRPLVIEAVADLSAGRIHGRSIILYD